MKEGKEIIEFTQTVVNNIEQIEQLMNDSLKRYIEYSDFSGDVITPLKPLVSAVKLCKSIKYRSFLEQYSQTVNQGGILKEREIEKLKRYLSVDKNVEFVSEIIDSAIHSKSSLCSAVMGYYAGTIITETREVLYKDMVILNALKLMNDYDLEFFLRLYALIQLQYPEKRRSFHHGDIKELRSTYELDLTMDKFRSVQIISMVYSIKTTVGSSTMTFKFNHATDYLYKIIKDSRVV